MARNPQPHIAGELELPARSVSGQLKQLTDRNDATDTSLWQQAFARYPAARKGTSPLATRSDRPRRQDDARRSKAVRTRCEHGDPETPQTLSEQASLERIATVSVLAHFVDHCEIEYPPKSDRLGSLSATQV